MEVGAGLRPGGGAFGLRARPGRAEAQALLARAIEFEDVPDDMNDESESRGEAELHDDACTNADYVYTEYAYRRAHICVVW